MRLTSAMESDSFNTKMANLKTYEAGRGMKFLHANWVDSIVLKIPRLIEIDNEQVVHPGARKFHGTMVKQ